MAESNVTAHKITKPIQLLGAWLVGLIVIDGSFLGTAVALGGNGYERLALVIAAIINVPLFIAAIFVLQTKFRPELQEDTFYHKYISQKTSAVITVNRLDIIENRLESLQSEINKDIITSRSKISAIKSISAPIFDQQWSVALNEFHPQFKQVESSLKEHNIKISTLFGKDAKVKIPAKWIIAMNEDMDPVSIHILLKAVSNFEFDGYAFWEPIKEMEPEDVYIGSYGDARYVALNDLSRKIISAGYSESVRLRNLPETSF